MKKVVILFLMLCSFAFGAEFDMKTTYSLLLNTTDDGFGEITDSKDIIVGSSGIVMHKFSDGSKSIIARAVVTEKKAGFAKVRFELFDSLKQPALPIPKILPENGDEIVLNYLYDRALIVAPNEEVFKEITNHFKNITFVHPDIMGSYLSYEYKPNPSRDDFRLMCAQNAAGVIFIALDGEAVFADCGSFNVLKKFKSKDISYYQLPFYTRITDIDTVFWKLDSAKIGNYNKYYKRLLGNK
ncbi:putative PgbA domain protein [Campylobacter iguaniorum]|uniref:plasminogen-binding N-terminal domain-containing protein n=1 Tax=Campylobacter iguaniorum TaxID=1244531 RepID=UPI0007C90222|nr:plasminogen-binding N-terminal domain-containing protein [Campylobacter iguaniorum]ANE35951.1 putative PgbA domain protein [Campylobacter iguaniorum]